MFKDIHPYLLIYLLGSLLVVLLILVKLALFHIIDWIIKANILNKNLKKLAKPNNTAWYFRVLKFLGILLFESSLSWINVVVVSVQIPYGIVKVLRDLFTPASEKIKELRFPLRNNPKLSPEAVWAYLMALNVKTGEALPKEHDIIVSIEEVLNNRPDFNYQNALDQIDTLQVINSKIVSSVKEYFVLENEFDKDEES